MKSLSKFSLFFLFTNPIFLFAQTFPVADAFVVLDSTGIDTVACKYIIVLEDTENIEKIEVTLARSAGDTIPLISYGYTYDVSTGLPAGWTYARKNRKITLEVGEINSRNSYFGKVRVKSSGSWSNPYKFICQLTF